MNRWSYVTDQIRAKLPHWWKMRKDKNSLGAQFLNVFGLTFEDVYDTVTYVRQQYKIGTADLKQADIIYKGSLPVIVTSSSRIRLTGSSYLLESVSDMGAFLTNMAGDELAYEELYYNNPFYVDWDKHFVYVRKPYDVTADYPEGSIVLEVLDANGMVTSSQTIQLHIHHVWNFFDEFGLLLDTPRLYGEKNEPYSERILDVFRHPANSTYRGLINGIGRDLGLTHKETWEDDRFDYIIYPPRVVKETIEVDGQPVDSANLDTDNSGRIILLGNSNSSGESRTITYIARLDLHKMGDKTDYAFQDQLYTAQGTATALLEYYVEIITKHVPVMWGQLVYGVGHWDITAADLGGTGYLPAVLDANFMAWASYVPKG